MTLRLLRALCPARAPHKARTPGEDGRIQTDYQFIET
jgi:hypothetical protein